MKLTKVLRVTNHEEAICYVPKDEIVNKGLSDLTFGRPLICRTAKIDFAYTNHDFSMARQSFL